MFWFLVGPDLLVTAGHCVTSQRNCESFSWVFDYNVKSDDQSLDFSVDASSVYKCSKIIGKILVEQQKNDFALIRLDREVTDRTPLRISSRR